MIFWERLKRLFKPIKIRNKLLTVMLIVVFLLMLITSITILRLVYGQEEKEKTTENEELVYHTLISHEYISNAIEQDLFNLCVSEQLAITLQENQYQAPKEYKISNSINNMVKNSGYFSSVFIVDTEERYYFGDENDTLQCNYYQDLWESGILMNSRDIYWIRDDNGYTYLRRNIYSTYPYKVVGYAIAKINMDKVNSLLGIDETMKGALAILDYQSQPVFMKEGQIDETSALKEIIINIQNEDQYYDNVSMNNNKYRIVFFESNAGDWYIVNVVSNANLLSSYFIMQRWIIITIIIVFALAAITCYALSWSFTKNIRILMGYINRISSGEMDLRLPQNMSDDEMGEVARSLNWMLERINSTHEKMLSENYARQQIQYELLDFEYRSLQAQVSPHFICNILSAISSFSIVGEQDKVESLSVIASKYLRENLNSNRCVFSTVREEFNRVDDYVELYKMVFSLNLNYYSSYTPAARNIIMPNIILLPLVENSLKHGTRNIGDEVFDLQLKAEVCNDYLRIELSDSGEVFKKEVLEEIKAFIQDTSRSTKLIGFGISGIIRRLELQYGNRYRFNIISQSDHGKKIILEIPIQFSGYSIPAHPDIESDC